MNEERTQEMQELNRLMAEVRENRIKRIETTIRTGGKIGSRIMAVVDLDLIRTDTYTYQREYKHNPKFGEFDIDKSGIIRLGYRNGEKDWLYAIDGNHRINEAKLAGVEHLFAEIFEDTNVQHEAMLFATQDQGKTAIKPRERFNALRNYDADMIAVNEILEKHDVLTHKEKGHKAIIGFARFISFAERHGAAGVDWYLTLNEKAGYDEEQLVYQSGWIRGIETIYTKNEVELMKREKNLIKTFREITIKDIKKVIKNVYRRRGSDTRISTASFLKDVADGVIDTDYILSISNQQEMEYVA